MTTGVIWKELLRFFLPIAAGTIFQQFYNAVDAIVVGKFVGTAALAAVGGSPAVILNLFISVFVSLTAGSSVLTAQFYGAGNREQLKKTTATAMTFFFLLGAIGTVVCEPLTFAMLDVLGTPPDTVADAAEYLRIIFLASPAMMLTNAQAGILRAVGDSRRPFIYLLVSSFVNIVLDLLFVIVFRMGVAGVAWATLASVCVNLAMSTVRLIRTKEDYRIEIRALGIDRRLLKEMLSLGIPAGLQGAMYGVSNAILQAAVNSLGTVVVASWAMSGKIDGVYWAIGSAFGTAVTTFAGQNYGAKKMDRVYACFRTGLKIFEPLTVLVCSAVMAAAPYLLPFFTDDAEVISTTIQVLWYFVPFYPVWTVIENLSGTLRGCGVVKKPVLITGLGICLFRIVWILTVCRIVFTLRSISLCYGVSWTITCIALSIYYCGWKKKQSAGTETVKQKAGTETSEQNAGIETSEQNAGIEISEQKAGTATEMQNADSETEQSIAGEKATEA